MEAFPICYALAIKKEGVIQDFDRWNGSKWLRHVKTRRPLFDWEMDQWKIFTTFLECIPIRKLISDTIAWTLCSSGLFSFGLFWKGLEESWSFESFVFKDIWQGICPPKIEVFLWQSLRGKVLVKDAMQRYGMNHIKDMDCSFYRSGTETMDYVFWLCMWSSSLWEECMSW
ncbi:hypothetical protein Ddye_021496 [Dipteronia dyeriana]|uniref:Reverse transcriptase zinc-binding domain-containing protein n=1 Tax=Dipteronia dyeriana TaxID=168575 RepID=A0AAD9U1R1_9ROSI|nr:hypothetical protein Ddye_021496 [Dipteronia dyeriana]